jgi:hypothetical protein
MSDEEEKQMPEQPIVEEQEQQVEEPTETIKEAELPPTPQDIDMPSVKLPKEGNIE